MIAICPDGWIIACCGHIFNSAFFFTAVVLSTNQTSPRNKFSGKYYAISHQELRGFYEEVMEDGV
jgi:hypothetical protein